MDDIRVLVVDDIPEARESVRKLLAFETDMKLVGEASTGREGLSKTIELRPDVVLMDINMPEMDGITATAKIVEEVPSAAVVVISVHKESEYLQRAMQAGATAFLEKPLSGDDLYEVIRRAYQLNAASRPAISPNDSSSRQNHLVAVYSPSGGVGKTTIAINLATALAQTNSHVLLVDGDLQFGDIQSALFPEADYTLADLIPDFDKLDMDRLESVLVSHPSGFRALLAPPHPDIAAGISPRFIREIVQYLAPYFDYTIVDMCVTLDELAYTLLDLADQIILVTTESPPVLRNCQQVFDIFEALGYPPAKSLLVLNRHQSSDSQSSAQKLLHNRIDLEITLDDSFDALQRGEPVVSDRQRASAQDLIALTDHVRQLFEGTRS